MVGSKPESAGVRDVVDSDLRPDRLELLERVGEHLGRPLIVASRQGQADLGLGTPVQLRRPAGTGTGAATQALELGGQEARCRKAIEVEGRQLASDAEGSRGLVPPDRLAPRRDELVQAPTLRLVEERDGTDGIGRGIGHAADSNSKVN
jgi:hypothetical protein